MSLASAAVDYYAEGALSTVFYDLLGQFDPSIQGDLDFYLKLAEGRRSALELGCGTGRVSQALAEAGLAVTGVDLAPAMLAQAKARRRKASAAVGQRLRYRLGNMAELSLGERFDLVISPYFSLAHLTPEDQARTFRAIAAHLGPDGIAALHLPIAERMAEPSITTPDQPVVSITFDAEGRQLRLHVMDRRFDLRTGRFDQTIDYVVVDSAGAELRRSSERMAYHAADFQGLAAAAGLVLDRPPEVLNIFGQLLVFRHG